MLILISVFHRPENYLQKGLKKLRTVNLDMQSLSVYIIVQLELNLHAI